MLAIGNYFLDGGSTCIAIQKEGKEAGRAPGRRPGEVVERGSGRATYARAATRVIAPS